jgi:hypothetical protein
MHKSRACTKSSTCRIHEANKFVILNDAQEESKRTVALLRAAGSANASCCAEPLASITCSNWML